MAKRRGNPNMDIRRFLSSPKRRVMDPEKGSGDGQSQGEELNNQVSPKMAKRREKKNNKNPQQNEEDLSLGGASSEILHQEPEIKSEDASKSGGRHLHTFLLMNKKYEKKKDTIQCDHPQTVLQAIKSKKTVKCDNNIILQIGEGKEATGTAIATHYPCTLLKEGELVTFKETKPLVQVSDTKRDYRVDLNERYYVIYIKTVGGTRSKTKNLFRSSLMKSFSQLCVYGTGNMTLKDAIERDGRFVELGDFELEDVAQANVYVSSNYRMQQYHEKMFWIRVKNRNNFDRAGLSKTDEAASNGAGESVHTDEAGPSSAGEAAALNAVSKPGWVSVGEVLKRKQAEGDCNEVNEIYKLLRAQFPELRNILESRFPDDTLNKTLKKVDFGKAQQTFSEVGRTKELFEMGESVCKITVGNVCEGTGFVLFQRYILTNAHLFDDVIYRGNLQLDLKTTAMFKYETPHQKKTLDFKVRNTFIDYDRELDYAVLELIVSDENKIPVPPGLMKHCGPMPESGEACIMGHPNGGVKMFDPTCIIKKENRENKAGEYLERFKDDEAALISVIDHIQKQGIKKIVSPSDPLYYTATYHTFMFHGSSGSPVFDAHCRVFGLHTGGFTYDVPTKGSVIEYARPVLLIFHQFVKNLKTSKNAHTTEYRELLKAVEEELKDNEYREEILKGELSKEER